MNAVDTDTKTKSVSSGMYAVKMVCVRSTGKIQEQELNYHLS